MGRIDSPDIHGEKYNYSCGDEIEVFMKTKEGKVEDFRYEVRGCAISVSGASLLSEEIRGMTLDEVRELDNDFIEDLMGTQFTSSRIKCAMLALDALKEAIMDK